MERFEAGGILRQALPVLLFCALFQFGAGSILGGMEAKFDILPGLLVMVPPLLALRGNISGALASRLGTGLHRGVIDSEVLWDPEVRINVFASIFLTLMITLTTGILASVVTALTGIHSLTFHLFSTLTSVALIAGVISSAGLVGLTVLVALFSFRRGWDPDNVTSPLMASIGDLITLASIYIAVLLVV